VSKVAKVTISMPGELFDAVERERKARGQTRSEFFARAVEDLLRRERQRRLDEEYIRGYREFPESEDQELQAWVQAASEALAQVYRDEQPWPEEQLEVDDRRVSAR
jgi:metal-responsive CopG/Arc/MetJ family transcriptional regulator